MAMGTQRPLDGAIAMIVLQSSYVVEMSEPVLHYGQRRIVVEWRVWLCNEVAKQVTCAKNSNIQIPRKPSLLFSLYIVLDPPIDSRN